MTKSSPVIGVLGTPLTEQGVVDAGFGSIYETVGFTGATLLILMLGTVMGWLFKKQSMLTYSMTKLELYAAREILKFIKWLHILMAEVMLI
jgi:hypothetical protein